MSIGTTSRLSFNQETGLIHAEKITYDNIYFAMSAYQHLFAESAKGSIELASQFNKALPSPELPIFTSIRDVEAEVKSAERQLVEIGFLGQKNSKPLLNAVREVSKKQITKLDELLLRPQIISAWLVETKKIVEKKPNLDIFSQIFIEEGLERNYLEHAEAILDHLQIHLDSYSSLSDLSQIRGLMFDIKKFLLNPFKIVAAPYKQVTQQITNLLSTSNIPEPQMLYGERFRTGLKEIIGICLKTISNGLEIHNNQPEFS